MRWIGWMAALLLLAASPAWAQESGCMARHLREAVRLNKERMPLYSELTGGRSRAISRRLIWAERFSMPVAWYVDWRARRFQRLGIAVVCADFEPMDRTPAFRPRNDDPPPLSAFAPADSRRIARAVERAYRASGFAGAGAVLEREIETLSRVPGFNCMTRHLLESALRITNGARRYAADAEARDVASPARLSRALLSMHLTTLGEAARLDRRAAPLQAEGVPIVCQDVPPIPADSPELPGLPGE
jgi:hypothetical protein